MLGIIFYCLEKLFLTKKQNVIIFLECCLYRKVQFLLPSVSYQRTIFINNITLGKIFGEPAKEAVFSVKNFKLFWGEEGNSATKEMASKDMDDRISCVCGEDDMFKW